MHSFIWTRLEANISIFISIDTDISIIYTLDDWLCLVSTMPSSCLSVVNLTPFFTRVVRLQVLSIGGTVHDDIGATHFVVWLSIWVISMAPVLVDRRQDPYVARRVSGTLEAARVDWRVSGQPMIVSLPGTILVLSLVPTTLTE